MKEKVAMGVIGFNGFGYDFGLEVCDCGPETKLD